MSSMLTSEAQGDDLGFHTGTLGGCLRVGWSRVESAASGELRLSGLRQHESHQASDQQQCRHQQHRDGAVRVHQPAEGHVAHDGRHPGHAGEETESGGPERGRRETPGER